MQAGDSEGAVNAFKTSIKLREQNSKVFDVYFMAIAQARLGQKDLAQKSYEWSVKNSKLAKMDDPRLEVLRAETESQLGLAGEPAGKLVRITWQPPRLLPP